MRDEQGKITTKVTEYDKASKEHLKNCDTCQVIKVCRPLGLLWECGRCRFDRGEKEYAKVGGKRPDWAKL